MAIVRAGWTQRQLLFGFLSIVSGLFFLVWLAKWLAGASLFIAVVLWTAAIIGVIYSSGGLPLLDRYPSMARLMMLYAPRSIRSTPARHARSPSGVGRSSHATATADTTPAFPAPDLSGFVGLAAPYNEMTALLQNPGRLRDPVAPADCVLMLGPRGTGKTSLALNMIARLQTGRIVTSNYVAIISEAEIPGLGDSHGPSAEAMETVQNRLQSALDGVIRLDKLDQLASLGDGKLLPKLGGLILALGRRHPRRIFVVATGLSDPAADNEANQRWLGQMHTETVRFAPFDKEAISGLATRLLTARGLRYAAGGEAELSRRARDFCEEPDSFDNAFAVQRFVRNIVHNQNMRLADAGGAGSGNRYEIEPDDINQAHAKVIR